MKMNAGIVTNKLQETRAFYLTVLNFSVRFENEFYLLLLAPDGESEISFLLPHHPSQQPLFHPPFNGKGVYITLEVEKVEDWYAKMQQQNVPVAITLRNEPWGDRHFAIQDPNGIGIDIVTYSPQE